MRGFSLCVILIRRLREINFYHFIIFHPHLPYIVDRFDAALRCAIKFLEMLREFSKTKFRKTFQVAMGDVIEVKNFMNHGNGKTFMRDTMGTFHFIVDIK
jgi:hypothetical protein